MYLKVSKCDQFGKGASCGALLQLHLPAGGLSGVYVTARGSNPGYFFRDREGKPLLKPRLVADMRRALAAIGIHQEAQLSNKRGHNGSLHGHGGLHYPVVWHSTSDVHGQTVETALGSVCNVSMHGFYSVPPFPPLSPA